MGFEADGPGFKSWFYQLEVWPWATHLPYLNLPFSRGKLELMIPVPQELGVRLRGPVSAFRRLTGGQVLMSEGGWQSCRLYDIDFGILGVLVSCSCLS